MGSNYSNDSDRIECRVSGEHVPNTRMPYIMVNRGALRTVVERELEVHLSFIGQAANSARVSVFMNALLLAD